MRFKVLALAIAVLILLSGCLDSLPADKRFQCLDLTEKSYAFVPECDSQEKCFALIQNRFFSFDHSLFSPEVQNKIHSYKNNSALSWLYFNKARKNISAVHNICQKNSSISSLVFELNELTHNMAKAFEFSGLANRESFAILLLEHSNLKEEDIMLVREEPLYADFSVLSENVARLSSPEKCTNTESYACFYLAQTQTFHALVSQTGFENRIMSETTSFDLLKPFSGEIGEFSSSNFGIPFIGPILPDLLSFLSGLSTANKSMEALEKAPAFELMQSYNSFMGEKNSCLSRFGSMLSKNALHRSQLVQRNSEMESKALLKLAKAEKNIGELLSENYTAFDQNFFQKLYSGLEQNSKISSQKYSIRDFGELRNKSEAEVNALRQKLHELQSRKALSSLSLGEEASSLKQLNSEISLLAENMSFLRDEVLQGLIVLCTERSSLIEQELNQSLPQDYASLASDSRARTKYKLSLFQNAEETDEKLIACAEMVSEFDSFSLAMQDFEQYLLEEKLSLGKCFSSLEAVLNSPQDSKLSPNLDSFSLRFQELKAIPKPYLDISYVKRICLTLESDLEAFLGKSQAIKQIEEKFAESATLLKDLSNAKALGAKIPDSKISSLEEELSHLSSFFSGSKLIPEKAVPVLQDLDASLFEFKQLLEENLDSAIASLAEKNAQISSVLPPEAEAGTFFDETIRVELNNPSLHTVDGLLQLSFPFEKTAGTKISSSPNVLGFEADGKKLSLDLNFLPPGKTFLEFSTKAIAEKTETTKLVSATSEKAIFLKEITLECERLIPNIEVKTSLLETKNTQFEGIFLSHEEKAIPFSQKNNQVYFSAQNCLGKTPFSLLFSVPKPVEITILPLSQEGVYSLSLKNLLPAELKNVQIILAIQEAQAEEIELSDISGKNIKFKTLPNQKISFSMPLLLPMQTDSSIILKMPPGQLPPLPTLAPEKEDPLIESMAENISEKIYLLSSNAEEAEKIISTLQKNISPVSDKELISSKYVLPLSRPELERLGLSLSRLKSFLSKPVLASFSELAEKGEFAEAVEVFKPFEKDLDEKILDSQTMLLRSQNALASLKEDTLISYNSVVSLFNSITPNEEAKQALSEAKDLLLEERFLESLIHSKKATSLLSLAPEKGLDFPVFLWPVFFGLGLVLAVRFKKKKGQKQKKNLAKMVEKSWR